MIFSLISSWWFWSIFLVLFFYISDLLKETKRLKKRNDYLEDENNKLKKMIFDLSEDKQFL
jgi:cell division protein FtsB